MSLLRRHRDESSDREAPVSPAVTGIRPTQQYALVDGTWYESARIFDDGRYPASGEIALYAPSGRRFTVAASAVATMQMVRAEARYRGYWFQIGSLWSTPASPGLPDVNRGRIRGAVPSGARDVFAAMLYRGPDGVAVAELPGAEPRYQWPLSYDEVTITVPVAELEGYREDAVDMTLDSA